jgi:hypothetical protein
MGFDRKLYIKLVTENKIQEAIQYKNSNLPKRLYKFVSLNDIPGCKQKEICPVLKLNDKKINSLDKDELWLSTYNYLNDPFEFNALYLDESLLESKNYPIDLAEKFLEVMKSWLIGSLTENLKESMPMWAHYANNHKGFCIEFSIEKPNFIFPVSYEGDRVAIASLISNHLLAMQKFSEGTSLSKEEIKNIEFSSVVLFHSFLIKDKSWSYEEEYRLLVPKEQDIQNGFLFPLDLLGLKVKNVYIGINCEKGYIERIKEISKIKKFGIKKMYFKKDSKDFSLSYRDIDVN